MRRKLFVYVTILLIGMALMYLYQEKTANGPLEYRIGEEFQCHGTVTEVKKKEDSYKLVVNTHEGKILCRYYGEVNNPTDLYLSDAHFAAVIEKPETPGNPRVFNYALYLKSREIYYVCTPAYMKFKEGNPSPYNKIRIWIYRARENFIRNLGLGSDTESFVRGVLFGDTDELDDELYEEFRKNSTAHVLAVSGLHIGVLYSLYKALLKKRNSRLITAIFVFFTLIYGFATLWSVSVTRAILLTYIMILGNYLDRRYDLITAAALVAAGFAVKNPYIIFGAGFQMSFLAVMSIAFITPVLEKFLPQTLSGAVAVQIGMLPYMIYNFNGFSLVGLLVNIPIVFLISLLVPAGVAAYFVYLMGGMILPVAPLVLQIITKVTVAVNHFFAKGEMFYVTMPSMKLGTLILIYGLIFFCCSEFFQIQAKRRNFKIIALCVVLIGATSFACYIGDRSPFDRASTVFINVGQGDAVHVKTHSNKNILIDGGGNINYNVGDKTLKPYLLKNGFAHVDMALATHLHADHYLGLEQLKEVYPVDKLVIEGKAGQKIDLGNGELIEILWPIERNDDIDDENLNSMIFRVRVRGLSVLITGDITAEGEKMLLERYAGTDMLKADILKVAHHGSAYSSSEEFLEAVKPKVAVISVGKNNYGHPSQDVIEKLKEKGIIVFRTDLDGAVGIIKKGETFSVCTNRNRKNMLFRPLQKT